MPRRTDATEQALSDAQRIDARTDTTTAKPLLGVPVAIKDTVAVKGELTTWGANAVTTVAGHDDPVVTALRRAGAIIIGKTNCSELAAWPFTETERWGQTRNPWNTNYSPGGSSGGSAAAVAAGMCGVALGSDGLGSIRAPASFTGLFGVKPQRGRIWHNAEDWNGLAVNGPIARSVADAALFLDATALDPASKPFIEAVALSTPLRIAVSWKPLARYPLSARLGHAQRAAVTETVSLLRDLGHSVFERELSYSRRASSSVITRYLSGVAQSSHLLEPPDALSRRTLAIVRFGQRISRRRLERVLRTEQLVSQSINQIFDDADVVMTPGPVQPPLRVGQVDGQSALRAFNGSGRIIPHYGPWNVIGQPAVSVPAGFDERGLPTSIHLAGRKHDEATLLALAAQLERARPWADCRPLSQPAPQQQRQRRNE